MRYTFHSSDGADWRIEDSVPLHRWLLFWREGKRWKNVGAYPAPDAAALAVASGDTGVTEWDDHPHERSIYQLRTWTRAENPPARSTRIGSFTG